MNLLIITACPNGMVTSVLTSRLLEAAAHRLGWSTAVEVHDPKAIGSPLTAEQIAEADLVVVVKTGPLSLQRFVGKRVVQSTPSEALLDPEGFLRSAVDTATELQPIDEVDAAPSRRQTQAGGHHRLPDRRGAHLHGRRGAAAGRRAQGLRPAGGDARLGGRAQRARPQAIEEADAVLLATDIEVDVTRFAGKRVFRCGTGVALKQPEATLDRALQEAAVLGGGVAASAATGNRRRRRPVSTSTS